MVEAYFDRTQELLACQGTWETWETVTADSKKSFTLVSNSINNERAQNSPNLWVNLHNFKIT